MISLTNAKSKNRNCRLAGTHDSEHIVWEMTKRGQEKDVGNYVSDVIGVYSWIHAGIDML